MPSPESDERFSRQVILPSVGPEGQKKWQESKVWVVGEGAVLPFAVTALVSAGVSQVSVISAGPFDSFDLVSRYPELKLDVLPEETEQLPKDARFVVLGGDPARLLRFSRLLRHQAHPALFGWCMGSGYALFAATHQGGQCPCLECFEIMNPKAFTAGQPEVQQLLGAMAASEMLQWILKEITPLEKKVWVTSLDTGVSFHHELRPTYKCPARMLEEGAVVTP